MPLHGQREAPRIRDPERLDETIRGARLDLQLRSEPLDSLRMQRIDSQLFDTRQRPQSPLGLQDDRVCRSVLHFERLRVVVAMVELAFDLVHALMQRATEGYVHLLEAAADPEHGHATTHGLTDQRQGGRITRWIVQGTRRAGRPRIMVRLDVGSTSGEQQSVHALEQLVHTELLGQGRNQQRQGLRDFQHGARILLSHYVKRMQTERTTVGRYTDEWTRKSHEGVD